ncbi:hypothetical protein ACJW30_03G158100 [Castanea mollissima]
MELIQNFAQWIGDSDNDNDDDDDDDDDDYSFGESKRCRLDGDIYKKAKPVNFVSTGTQKIDNNGGSAGLGFTEEEEEDFLPTVFGKMIKEGALKRMRGKEKSKGKRARDDEGGFGFASVGGEFEKHTKGIGMKLLQKMGYKGGGLGKNAQGIVTPIEPKLRPKNMGTGFNDFNETEEKKKKKKKKKGLLGSDCVGVEKVKEKRLGSTKKKKKKKVEKFVTKAEQGSVVVQMVYDMRGPQLQYNVRLAVDLVELEIDKIHRDLRNEEATAERLKEEKDRLSVVSERQKRQLYSMVEILSVLDQLEEDNSTGDLTLDSLAELFIQLKSRFAEDCKLCNLSVIACSYALPLFIRVFQGWDPLQNPFHGFEIVSLWKSLLLSDQEFTASPYSQLISQVLLPAVRLSLLPPSVLHYIMDYIVMPKLNSAVGCWEPLHETVPIHLWVHPWLQYLGHKLEGIFETIRFKLSQVFVAWHPSDASTYTILSPWKAMFDSASWEHLMSRFIKLDEFHWVMKWASDIPIHLMVDMMVRFFFSKWQKALYHWLRTSPNFEEIKNWYLGWKELLPKELLANESIWYQLNCGLEMMNQAVEGLEVVQPGFEENIGYFRVLEQRQFEAQQKAVTQQAAMSFSMDDMSIKEVIEAHAQQHGLLFKPKPGRRHDGHQIYAFGNLSVIIDALNQKVYGQN